MKRLWALLGGLVFFAGLSSCYVGYDPYYYDYPYYDGYYYYGYDGYWVYTWVDGYGVYYYSRASNGGTGQQTVDVNAAAAAIADHAGTFFTPASCVTAVATGATINYGFLNCAGKFGLQNMSGTASVTVTANDGGLQIHGTSSDLTVNGKPYLFDVTAIASRDGTERHVSFNSDSHSPEVATARQDQGTLTWQQGSVCIDASGAGTSSQGEKKTAVTVSSYHRCNSTCPTSGTVTAESPEGSFSGKFDGSPHFVVVAPNGDKKSYDLQCSQ